MTMPLSSCIGRQRQFCRGVKSPKVWFFVWTQAVSRRCTTATRTRCMERSRFGCFEFEHETSMKLSNCICRCSKGSWTNASVVLYLLGWSPAWHWTKTSQSKVVFPGFETLQCRRMFKRILQHDHMWQCAQLQIHFALCSSVLHCPSRAFFGRMICVVSHCPPPGVQRIFQITATIRSLKKQFVRTGAVSKYHENSWNIYSMKNQQDGNHEPKCSHVILRWTGHNQKTMRWSALFYCRCSKSMIVGKPRGPGNTPATEFARHDFKIDVSCEASVDFQHMSENATPATEFAPWHHFAQRWQCDSARWCKSIAPATENRRGRAQKTRVGAILHSRDKAISVLSRLAGN